ncbi:MAG TPA: hypothetical protein VNH18_32490 [Bryobacteraceae bacterium]|nr:hypothetical protein [Bryobacteraceae bacterium]
MSEKLELGGLVQYRERPGVWRVVEVRLLSARIEPWDDAAAAACHVSEVYDIAAPLPALSRLLPGRSAPPHRAIAAALA